MPHLALSLPVMVLLLSAADHGALAEGEGHLHHDDSVRASAPTVAALPLPHDPAQSCSLAVAHRNASD